MLSKQRVREPPRNEMACAVERTSSRAEPLSSDVHKKGMSNDTQIWCKIISENDIGEKGLACLESFVNGKHCKRLNSFGRSDQHAAGEAVGFLGQVLSHDRSCRSAVARLIPHRFSRATTSLLGRSGRVLPSQKATARGVLCSSCPENGPSTRSGCYRLRDATCGDVGPAILRFHLCGIARVASRAGDRLSENSTERAIRC
jgi:hypothetical protein